eukprot:3959586-Karenia_brevis.AAC.1
MCIRDRVTPLVLKPTYPLPVLSGPLPVPSGPLPVPSGPPPVPSGHMSSASVLPMGERVDPAKACPSTPPGGPKPKDVPVPKRL